MSRYTASSEKEETEAMFPVLKKAEWRRKRAKRERRRSERVRARYGLLGRGRMVGGDFGLAEPFCWA